MNSKKPRETRKPLNQSFLEFVHGATSPELDTTTSAASGPGDEAWQPLQQTLEELQQRLRQLEEHSSDRGDPAVNQLQQQVAQMLQRVEELEERTHPQLQHLHNRITDLEDKWPVVDQLIHQLTQLSPAIYSTEDSDMNSLQVPTSLLERIDRLEAKLLEHWEKTTQSLEQFGSQMTTLTQEVERLSTDVRRLSTHVQQYLSSPPSVAATPRVEELPNEELDSQVPAGIAPASAVDQTSDIPHAVGSDPLLSRLSVLLDDF